jgi:hypothetical protein
MSEAAGEAERTAAAGEADVDEDAAGAAGAAGEADVDEAPVRRRARNAGVVLFLLAVVGLIVLAIAGFTPALYLLVLAVVGTGLVILGARLH